MKLTDTAQYLALVRNAFNKDIVPDLQSPGAKNAAELINVVLADLARRATSLPSCLHEANARGEHIVTEMRTALADGGSTAPATSLPEEMPSADFDAAAARFANLCADLAALGAKLRDRPAFSELTRKAALWESQAHTAFLNLVPPPVEASEVKDPLPARALEDYMRGLHPFGSKLRLASLDRLPGGFGKQTYLAEIEDGANGRESLVIRKNDRNPLSTYRSFRMNREFHLLKIVSETGFPAPAPLWFGEQVPGADAEFMVMKKMPGRMIGTFMEGTNAIPEKQILDMAELLARLHNIELERFSDLIHRFDDPALLTDTVEDYMRRSLRSWREYAGATGYLPSPAFDYLLGWLESNVPADRRRPALVHGDFSIHNLLGDANRISAVLDWEGSLFGAPELDLAYLKPAVSQHFDWHRFIEHYLRCGGRAPMLETLDYYLAFNNMRISLTLSKGVSNLQERISNDIRLVMFELGIVPKVMGHAMTITV
ncbi:MAG: phosphotransferase family protein [Spongiibacteraceae bacterium]